MTRMIMKMRAVGMSIMMMVTKMTKMTNRLMDL